MTTAMLLMLLGSPPAPPAESPRSAAPPAAAMVIGDPPAATTRSSATPELLQHADGGISIVFPEGYQMRTTLRRGFNGVWFTDCGPLPSRAEAAR